jgi:hypothetical protein
MLPRTKEFIWAFGLWLSDNSSKVGVVSKDIELIIEFWLAMKKYFMEFHRPIVQVHYKNKIEKEKVESQIKNLISASKIFFYKNPKQYGNLVFQLHVNSKALELKLKNSLTSYSSWNKSLLTALMCGKLDGDGNVNVSRGIIEWYYVSQTSLLQLKEDLKILKLLGYRPNVRKHKNGLALVLGSKKENFREVIKFSNEALDYVKLNRKRKDLKKLADGQKFRDKDLRVLELVRSGFNTSDVLCKELNYSPRTMRQIMQNLVDVGYIQRHRKGRNQFYLYSIAKTFDSTKDES